MADWNIVTRLWRNEVTDTQQRPAVGVSTILVRGDTVLLGRRLSSHGAGAWQFPGGHLEFGESIEACARREVLEETSLTVASVRLGPYTNDIFVTEGRHYITLFVIATDTGGDAVVREPEKCAAWAWFRWVDLPAPLFLPIENLLYLGFSPLSG
jgi:8-oxo-dGTP diphosphatase